MPLALLPLPVGSLVLLVLPGVLPADEPWRIEGDAPGAELGRALATGDVNGDGHADLVVGAPGTHGGRGRVRVYLGSSAGLAPVPDWSVDGAQPGERLGAQVATADVDGDGRADVIVTAPGFDREGAAAGGGRAALPADGLGHHASRVRDEGRLLVFLGTAAGVAPWPQRIVQGIEVGERFGEALASAGDVNGDGTDDVIVGAPGKLDGLGGVFVFLGSPSGLLALPSWMRTGNAIGEGLGTAVGSAGDLDSDGFADILVSAPLRDACGRTQVFRGSPDGPAQPPITVNVGMAVIGPTLNLDGTGKLETLYLEPRCSSGRAMWRQLLFSSVVGSYPVVDSARALAAGDLNGDGRPDVLVGSPDFEYGPFRGRVWGYTLLPGRELEPFDPFPAFDGDQPGADWGAALATGDIDGDGADELFIGAPLQDEGATDEGVVVMVPGRRAEVAFARTATLVEHMGEAASGDFDADGFDDLVSLAGTYYSTHQVEVRYGSTDGLSPGPDHVLGRPAEPGDIIASFASGDFDGDGHDDVLVSYFPSSGYGRTVVPARWLFLGGPGGLDEAFVLASGPAAQGFEAGDVNGDGRDDVLIASETAIALHLGTSGGLELAPSQTFAAEDAYFGRGILVGNLDGDGFSDVLIVRADGTEVTRMTGSPAGLAVQDVHLFPPEMRFDALTDLDGDGLDEVLLAHLSARSSYTNSWQRRVYRGTPGGFAHVPQWWEDPLPLSDDPDELFQVRVFAVLDADQDGHDDLLMTGHRLHRGAAGGPERMPIWSGVPADVPGLGETWVLEPVTGDFDGDGHLEVIGWTGNGDFELIVDEVQEL
jgi:hypothetical protein